MAVARTLIALVLATLAGGCAFSEDSADQAAGAAVKRVIEQEYAGDYRAVWDTLHPRHQRLVTRDQYEDCRRSIDVTGALESVLILDVKDAPLTIFGLQPRTPSKAVKVRVTTDETEYTSTYHVVRVGGGWRWVLTNRAARGFARGPCPA